jgi:hypothetical protein
MKLTHLQHSTKSVWRSHAETNDQMAKQEGKEPKKARTKDSAKQAYKLQL